MFLGEEEKDWFLELSQTNPSGFRGLEQKELLVRGSLVTLLKIPETRGGGVREVEWGGWGVCNAGGSGGVWKRGGLKGHMAMAKST